jgi:hypothetical protein
MNHKTIIVRADWDATSGDIEGLATEASTLEALRTKLLTMVVELLELNGDVASDLPEIPVHIMAQQTACVPNPAYH